MSGRRRFLAWGERKKMLRKADAPIDFSLILAHAP